MICHLLMKTLAPDAVNSDVDALTGLLNRRGLEVRAKELVGDHTHRRVDVMMAVIDLDRFKLINDTHGHEAGDQVLISVAATLTGASGSSALVARIGGEEFVVELGRPTYAQQFGDLLAEAIRSAPCGVTASVGVTTATISSAEDTALYTRLDGIIGRADRAMYDAKRAGGNRCRQVATGHRTSDGRTDPVLVEQVPKPPTTGHVGTEPTPAG